jgi:hypothetical protein
MTNKTDWQEANRRLTAEQQQNLGDPPTAEEMLAYSRGELGEAEEERIRDLLVAYPDLARMYSAPFPEEPEPGVTDEAIAAGYQDLQRRMNGNHNVESIARRGRAQRYIPTTIAAGLALVFFGLYVQAENRARDNARNDTPYVLGAPQELDSDATRGSDPTLLRKDGGAYLLKLALINQLRFEHYTIELHDQSGVVWTSHSAEPDAKDAFLLVIPHGFLRAGARYQLSIYGVDGQTRRPLGSYDVATLSE